MQKPIMNHRMIAVWCLLLCASVPCAALDTITVIAESSTANEAGEVPGRFRITRTGTTGNLPVVFKIASSIATPAYRPGFLTVVTAGSTSSISVRAPGGNVELRTDDWISIGTTHFQVAANVTVASAATPVTLKSSVPDGLPVDTEVTLPIRRTSVPGYPNYVHTDMDFEPLTLAGTGISPVQGSTTTFTVNIAPGTASSLVLIQPIDDKAIEGNEPIVLTLIDDPGYVLGSRFSSSVALADDDTLGQWSIPDLSATEHLAGTTAGADFEAVFRFSYDWWDLERWATIEIGGVASQTTDYNLGYMVRHDGGGVIGVTIENRGSGYTSVPLITDTTNIGIGAGGRVTGLRLSTRGTGYRSPPVVQFTGGSPSRIARAVATIDSAGSIDELRIVDGGEGYSSLPSISFQRTDGLGGADAVVDLVTLGKATFSATMRLNAISSIDAALLTSKYGLNSAPLITILYGGGAGAAATATVNGSFLEFHIDNPGYGYEVPPNVGFINSAGLFRTLDEAQATLELERVWVTDSGAGYQAQPTLTVDPPPSGTTAVLAANITRGALPTPPIPGALPDDSGDNVLNRRTKSWTFTAAKARVPLELDDAVSSATYGGGQKNANTLAVSAGTEGYFSVGDILQLGVSNGLYRITRLDGDIITVYPALNADLTDGAEIFNVITLAKVNRFSQNLIGNYGGYFTDSQSKRNFFSNSSGVAYWGMELVVTPIDDAIAEAAEPVSLRVTSSSDYTISDPTNATLVIADDDALADIVTITDASEPNQAGQVKITFSTALPVDVEVPFAVSSSTTSGAGFATLGIDCIDFTTNGLTGSITIPSGQTSVVISIDPIADGLDEGSERLTITLLESQDYLLAGTPGSKTNPSATVNIIDRQGEVGVAVYPVQSNSLGEIVSDMDGVAAESMGTTDKAQIRVLFADQSSVNSAPFGIRYSVVSGSTATAGSDYVTLSGVLTVPTGQLRATLAANANGSDPAVLVALDAGTRTLQAGEFIMVGGELYRVQVLTELGTTPVSVPLTTSLLSPTPIGNAVGLEIRDFSGNPIVITIDPVDDQIVEGDEVVVLTLSAGAGYSIAQSASNALVTIRDDEPILKISVEGDNPSEYLNGDAKSTGKFVVSYEGVPKKTALRRAIPFAISIDAKGTATASDDYTALSKDYVIPANNLKLEIPVSVNDDILVEPDETIVVHLVKVGTSPGYDVSAGGATMIITDNEPLVGIKAESTQGFEGGAGPSFKVVNLTSIEGGIKYPKDLNVTVRVDASSTVTLTGSDRDIETIQTRVIIAAFQDDSVPILVQPIDDTLIEGDETIVIDVVELEDENNKEQKLNYTVDETLKRVTLRLSDNTEPTLSIEVTQQGIEGSVDAVFRITSDIVPQVDALATLEFTGTATKGVDYNVGVPIIIAGKTFVDLVAVVVNDAEFEETETIIATLKQSTPPRYFISATQSSATATIIDDEPLVSVAAVNPAAPGVPLAEPATNGAFTISRNPSSINKAITVNFSIVQDATTQAIEGTDFQAIPRTVDIPAGVTSVNVPVIVIDDLLVEDSANEKVILALQDSPAPITYKVDQTQRSAQLIILDDEPMVGFASPVATAAEPATNATVTLQRLAGSSAVPLTIVLQIDSSSTATVGTDVAAFPLTISMPAGVDSVAFSVNVLDDNLVESQEKLVIVLVKTSTYSLSPDRGSVRVNVDDDDGAGGVLSLSLVRDAIEPNQSGAVRFAYAPPTGILRGTFSAPFVIGASSTAIEGLDYVGLPRSVTFGPGQTEVLIEVAPIPDFVSEGDETVSFGIDDGPTWSVGGPKVVDLTIHNFDSGSGKPPIADANNGTSSSSCGLGGGLGLLGVGLLVAFGRFGPRRRDQH